MNWKALHMSDAESFDKRANLFLEDGFRDTSWKIEKSTPLIATFLQHNNEGEINLLDVGGGSGLYSKMLSSYIEKSFGKTVNKFALDPSPKLLQHQKNMNPDLKRAFCEDIRKTSLSDKNIDLTLMIDVLEHVPNPVEAMEELRRISKFVLLKVPLEDCLLGRISNVVMRGKPRQHQIETIGHINIFNLKELRRLLEKHMGQVLDFYFTNVFEYFLNSKDHRLRLDQKLKNFVAVNTFRLSPTLCSLIFYDHVMILVKCNATEELSKRKNPR